MAPVVAELDEIAVLADRVAHEGLMQRSKQRRDGNDDDGEAGDPRAPSNARERANVSEASLNDLH